MKKINWGILSTAKIAREKVIPALQASKYGEVKAIASRDLEHGKKTAAALNIPIVYGSYEDLLSDPNIDAIYNPLPNHLHVPYTLLAIKAGKHVLCEKPLATTAFEAHELMRVASQSPHLKVMEAFMYRFHPQWVTAKKLVQEGRIGTLKTIQSFFSYYNDDPNNIRNKKEMGGGGMMDIGCYCISLSRFIFDKEPTRVIGLMNFDPVMETDTFATGILDFNPGTSTFTCSTQLAPYQRVNILGTEARLEIEIPFNAPPKASTRIWVHSKSGSEEISFDAVDQYVLQGDLFAQSVLNDTPVPTPLQDAVENMRVITAMEQSVKAGMGWAYLTAANPNS